jgi:hypothetical protein
MTSGSVTRCIANIPLISNPFSYTLGLKRPSHVEEYKAAEQFLHNLRQDFPLNPEQIILVPGNHDLNWKQAKKAYKLIGRDDYDGELKNGDYIEESASVIRVRDEAEYKQRFAHFSSFYETIKQQSYPLDYDQQYTIDHLKERSHCDKFRPYRGGLSQKFLYLTDNFCAKPALTHLPWFLP